MNNFQLPEKRILILYGLRKFPTPKQEVLSAAAVSNLHKKNRGIYKVLVALLLFLFFPL
jgi:hypothetical protein